MKKFLLLLLLPLIFCGCSGEPEPPINWNVDENTDWSVWAKGTLVKIEKVRLERCKHKEIQDTCWFNYRYTFNDDSTVLLRKIKNPGLVKAGQTGTLYKLGDKGYALNSHFYARYQWIEDKDKTVAPPAKKVEKSDSLIDYSEITSWINVLKGKPERHKIVLLKLNNNTLILGYLDNINEWKWSHNKNEEDGGVTIPNNKVIFWKSVDIR